MRKGYIQKIFDQKVENGLSELLIGDINLNDAIKETFIDNLSVVTRGNISPNPSELLMGQRFTQFIQNITSQNKTKQVSFKTKPVTRPKYT
ncbi:MAG: tyrosine-protein kinase Etk/Wzc [Pseudohongiellaceae bacterium]|jgi:tyrosine-protein kinase Etk/Wzc